MGNEGSYKEDESLRMEVKGEKPSRWEHRGNELCLIQSEKCY